MNRYQRTPVIKNKNINNGKRYYAGTKYPEIPLEENDVYVITTEGDSLDVLAQQIYGDKNLWWVLSIANVDLSQNSLYIPVGSQLRIPSNIQKIISSYNRLNSL